MTNKVAVKTVEQLLKQAQFRNSFKILPKGKTYKNLSTVIVIPTPGQVQEKKFLNCKKCKCKNEYTHTSVQGLNPIVVESWKRLLKPMNVPIIEMMINGHEVGEAYNLAVDTILGNPSLKDFKYMLTIEHDNIIPFMPNSQGPLMSLFECIEKGYDVAGGLYWTKGEPSYPLVYGEPHEKRDSKGGMFKVRHDFKENQIVECNGMGMGFTLFKMDIFKDKRLERPYFKTVSENTDKSTKGYTQDLYFFEKIRELDYKVCVDTRVRLGHLDFSSGKIY